MIRGVNKNVIEILDTENECFERAILFVRPDGERQGEEHLNKRAVEYLSGVKLRPRFYRKGAMWLAAARLGGAAALGAAVTALLLR